MLQVIILSTVAGVVGTGIGGVIGLFFAKKTNKTISSVLTFASGVMVAIALLDLMPEAKELGGTWLSAFGLLLGVVVVGVLNHIIDKITQNKKTKIQTHITVEELYHEEQIIKTQNSNKANLFNAGIIMLVAISLHNFPEGIAIGASNLVNFKLGLTLSVLLLLHNIPEGMAMAVPLVAGGVSKKITLILVTLAGFTTMFGGVFGAFVGGLNNNVLALSLSFAAGAMLYVTFCEIFPQSILMEQGRKPALFGILGILIGFVITNLI